MQLDKALFSCLLIPLLVLCLNGCEMVPDTKPLMIDANKVVVLHVEALHKELKDSSKPIYRQLINNIEKKGFQVESMTAEHYQQLREEALLVSGSVYDPNVGRFIPLNRSVYIKAIVDLSARQFSHDIVLIPEVVLRTASVVGDKASWDNVEREVTFINQPLSTYDLPRKIKGLSLRLAGYTYNGAEVFLNFSGVSLPYHMRYFDGKITPDLKEQFFTDDELEEGVDLALEPFFEQVTYKNGK